jgi:hypothetical protein
MKIEHHIYLYSCWEYIVGAQVLEPGDVSKQIAAWATAIKGKLTAEDMVNVDLSYAPPYSLAIDRRIATAHIKSAGRWHNGLALRTGKVILILFGTIIKRIILAE